jgi:DNA-binding IclR family transcriptional regulator
MEPIPQAEPKPLRVVLSEDSPAPALARGLALIEVLDLAPEGLTLTELSDAIDSPKNSTLRLIQVLVDQGWAVRDPITLRVQLTSKVLRLGQPRSNEVSLAECALPAMRRLRDESGETVQFGVLSGEEVVVIEKQESRLPVRIGVDVGLRILLHDNAPGKVFLAFLPEPERESLLARIPLPASTSKTITDRAQLRIHCEEVRKQGHSLDVDENYEGLRCVAVPILDRLGHVLAAIWVSGPAKRLPESVLVRLAPRVKAAAKEIEERIHL